MAVILCSGIFIWLGIYWISSDSLNTSHKRYKELRKDARS